jgi:hypothetical protein
VKSKVTNYVFDPAAGTIRLVDLQYVVLDRLLMVTNATRGVTMYVFADASPGVASVVDRQTFKLTPLAPGMAATDQLVIYYEFDEEDPPQDRPIEVKIADTEQEIPVDVRLDGVDARAESPGVKLVTLSDFANQTVDIVNGALSVRKQSSGDRVVGGDVGGTVGAQRTVGSYVMLNVQNAAVAGALTASPIIDCAGYRSMSVYQTTTTQINFFGSNDRVNWTAVSLQRSDQAAINIAAVASATAGSLYAGTVRTRYVRFTITANVQKAAVLFFSEHMDYAGAPVAFTIATSPGDTVVNAAGNSTVAQPMTFDDVALLWAAKRTVVDSTDTVGTGVTAVSGYVQLDEISPLIPVAGTTTVGPLEDRFAAWRFTPARAAHLKIRDGGLADAERGAQVSDRYGVLVEDANADLLDGNLVVSTSPGVLALAYVGPDGQPVNDQSYGSNVFRLNRVLPTTGYNSPGTAASGVTSRIGVYVTGVVATNANPAIRFLLLFNDNTPPTAGSVPALSFPLGGGSGPNPEIVEVGKEFFSKGGMWFSRGVTWGISTTDHVFAAGTPANHTVNATYRAA